MHRFDSIHQQQEQELTETETVQATPITELCDSVTSQYDRITDQLQTIAAASMTSGFVCDFLRLCPGERLRLAADAQQQLICGIRIITDNQIDDGPDQDRIRIPR
jgi:hypothetical protein